MTILILIIMVFVMRKMEHFLNDLAGNKQWDWDDANGNGVCDGV